VVRIDPSQREGAVAAVIGMMRDARKRRGCVSCVFAEDIEDPSVLHVFEEWESPEALRRYLRAPRAEARRLQVGQLGIREIALEEFEVDAVGPIV
jgi:quinol monooxygenase YgiN